MYLERMTVGLRKGCRDGYRYLDLRKTSHRILAIVAGVVVVGCILGIAAAPQTPSTDLAAYTDPAAKYYVSIGDSYAAGYRPTGPDSGSNSTDGFAYQVADELRARQPEWQLVNFGCSGETASAMSFDRGCEAGAGAPGGPRYPDDPQSVAAAKFITEHRDQIGLITVVMGGNDILPCGREIDPDRARACAEEQMPKVRQNLDALLARLRATVGPSVPIVGASYMNVLLADQLRSDPQIQRRAAIATILFRDYLNPVLAQTYQEYGARFVDTTALAGGYLPDTEKTSLVGHGTVPASVGWVCALTYYCSNDDPHPNRDGHALIAREIEKLADK